MNGYIEESKENPYLTFVSTIVKRKDSLEGSLDQVFFASELEFPKILVPRLPQNKSNVKIECATSFLEH